LYLLHLYLFIFSGELFLSPVTFLISLSPHFFPHFPGDSDSVNQYGQIIRSGVFLSQLTPFVRKSNRVLVSVTISIFWLYLTGTSSFSGIFRKSSFFDATQPISLKMLQQIIVVSSLFWDHIFFSRIQRRAVYHCINSRRKRIIQDSEHTQPTPTHTCTHTATLNTHRHTQRAHSQTTRSTPVSLDS